VERSYKNYGVCANDAIITRIPSHTRVLVVHAEKYMLQRESGDATTDCKREEDYQIVAAALVESAERKGNGQAQSFANQSLDLIHAQPAST